MAGLWKKFNPANDLYDQPLAYRGTIAPFGTYTNPDGSESAGFAWPGMITEPLNALQRLHENSYTEDGRLGMPNPQYQGNKDDALTSLLSIYGGNALNHATRLPENAIGMFAGRHAKTADTKAVKAWHSTPAKFDTFDNAYTDEVGFHFGSKNQAHNRAYAMSDGNPWTYFTKWRDIPVEIEINNPVALSTDPGSFMPMTLAKQLVKDGLAPHELIMEVQKVQLGPAGSPAMAKAVVRDYLLSKGYDAVKYPNRFEGVGDPSYMMLNTGNVKHARTGETLYSDTGKPSIAGSAIAAENANAVKAWHSTPAKFDTNALNPMRGGAAKVAVEEAPQGLSMNDPWLDAWQVPARSVDAGSGWSASHLTSIPGMMQIAQAKNIGNLFEIKDGVPVVRVARGWKPGAEDFLRENSALKWSEKVPTGWHLTNAGPVYYPNPLTAFNETEIASQIEKEFDAVLRPKLDYYYRGTNNKREIDMIKNMSIRRSKNHATGEIEPGLSVSSGPETLWAYDYPYGYKVRGDVAGLGSDGEPTLNINSLNAIGDLKKSSQLMAEWDDMVSKVAADHGISSRPLIGIGARDKIDYLFSDTGKPSIAGATAASADQDEISLDEFLRRYGVTY